MRLESGVTGGVAKAWLEEDGEVALDVNVVVEEVTEYVVAAAEAKGVVEAAAALEWFVHAEDEE